MAVLERVEVDEARVRTPDAWYFEVPAIAALRSSGVDLDPRVTVIVGENGSGKSTFVEAVAAAWRSGLKSEVGHWGPEPADEDADLHRALWLRTEWPRPDGGCFLRAEAMHGLFTEVDAAGTSRRAFDGGLNSRSHGEAFLRYLESRTTERGLFLLDEPEAALSFTSCLQLLSLLAAMADTGSQVVLATHSPLLAALPGATILEFGEHGIRPASWAELELVNHWQAFLSRPESYLRHLF
ncbi:AAA family ATPase [Jatrophihabitans sp.]|uniref:AAA family ATPase n=1 Tax=Jatrophihabitans sp. TaxID=1932789 RepID=UPI002C96FBDF|nr:AAA family ATPase [Jatrophihabitans sp.]